MSPRSQEDRNIRLLYLDNALQGIGSAGAAVYLIGPLAGAALAQAWSLRAAMLCGAGVFLVAATLFQRLMFGEIHD